MGKFFLKAVIFGGVLMGLTFAQDSSKVKILGIRPSFLQFAPFPLKSDSLRIQLKYPKSSLKIHGPYFDSRQVMPKNRLFWDYRESSYYTPWWVQSKMARIMNRPTPGEVWPVWSLALIATKLAMQQLEIKKKITIKAEDYLIEKKYWPILKALWDKSPQSAVELYEKDEIRKNRTIDILKQDLQFLIDQKLVKPRSLPGEPRQYFAAQSRGKAILLIEKALASDRFSMMQKKKFLDFKNYLVN